MHDLADELNYLPKITVAAKECITCGKALPITLFKRDSSYRDGRRDQCSICESTPRMSVHENVCYLRERNYKSEAVKRQRFLNITDYKNEAARTGRPMHHSELIYKLRTLIPNLFITSGNIAGDLAVFRIYDRPHPRLKDTLNPEAEYLFYIPTGVMPEYSLVEFDFRDVPIREKQRGWRTVLLRLIKSGLVSEKRTNEVFGTPRGDASLQTRKQLFALRNGYVEK